MQRSIGSRLSRHGLILVVLISQACAKKPDANVVQTRAVLNAVADAVVAMARDTRSTNADCLTVLDNLLGREAPVVCASDAALPPCRVAGGARCWGGPYWKTPLPFDAWSHPLIASAGADSHGAVVLSVRSTGPDGRQFRTGFRDRDDVVVTRHLGGP